MEPNFGPKGPAIDSQGRHWTSELSRYHWFVLGVAALGWLFDCLDQQLFNLARVPAMRELLRVSATEAASKEDVSYYAGLSTAIFLIGWATGGIVFGIMGDRIGRAKTMMYTILLYSLCTGLSALSVGFWDFAFYRFITGLGVGGEFAVGVSLVAEVMPNRARPFALGLLQALSAVGNVSAAVIGIVLGSLEQSGAVGSAWRVMFVIGTVPALLAIVIRRRLKEPEAWTTMKAQSAAGLKLGSFSELFGNPVYRKRTILGVILASAGVVGLWGIGFFSFDLFRTVFRAKFEAEGIGPEVVAGLSPEQAKVALDKVVDGKLTLWTGILSIMQNIGGFLGIYAFSRVTHIIGRRPAFAIAFVAAAASTVAVFWTFDEIHEVFWLIPIMGFCQLSLFGGYAIYFPELFPTRLRSTGTSFCYNVGRFAAAIGPYMLGSLTSTVFVGLEREPMRYAGVSMCSIFVIGLLVLPFLPETRGKPLPE